MGPTDYNAYVEGLPLGSTLFISDCKYVWVKRDRGLWRCISSSRLGDVLSNGAMAKDLATGGFKWVIM